MLIFSNNLMDLLQKTNIQMTIRSFPHNAVPDGYFVRFLCAAIRFFENYFLKQERPRPDREVLSNRQDVTFFQNSSALLLVVTIILVEHWGMGFTSLMSA